MTTLSELSSAAQQEAALHGSAAAGVEHFFLAWLRTASGPASEALGRGGVTADAFAAQLGAPRVPRGEGDDAPQLSSHARQALTQAEEIARLAGRSDVTADDVALALFRQPRGAMARALAAARLKPGVLARLVQGREATPRNPVRTLENAPTSRPPREKKATQRRANFDPEVDNIPEAKAPTRPQMTPPPKPAELQRRSRRWSWWWTLYLALPASIAARLAGADAVVVFALSGVALVPLARLLSRATEHVADRTNPATGALLNAAFGNATELIVAIAALHAGYLDLVQQTITGSILGNLLLILGIALFVAGRREPIVRFNRTASGMSSAMLALAVAAMVLPSVLGSPGALPHTMAMSRLVAVILIATYAASLLFSLRTHRGLFNVAHRVTGGTTWPLGTAIGVLLAATVGVAVESELLVDTIVPVTHALGITAGFIGLIVLPIIGNAAEHATAVIAARNGRTELAIQVALGSSTQIALLVAPVLVLIGAGVGRPLAFVFPMFHVAALAIGVIVAGFITFDGESHWLEGVQLLALYLMFAIAAWFI